MTQKEIEKARKEVYKKYDSFSPADRYNTPESIELRCRDMINSCLCYGSDPYSSSYVQKYEKDLGKSRVLELIEEQKEDFAKATVYEGVHTDSEGVVYNSIVWADDEKDEEEPEM